MLYHPAFPSDDFDTNFVRNHFQPSVLQPTPSPELAQLAAFLLGEQKGAGAATASNGAAAGGAAVPVSNWKKNRLAR
ncbi:hypothetical protein [Hymenobacter jeollabukensis]|uniref:Uncharacterized protein n=1 Tax=Hymenobacter jeollabukensis TaxID=2025313 RepID=A0A5R8WVA7_9BACT|nr:hypothetical protein [Hymenobacter jeollabukensis]TLM96431.1 hypothetical protein FDY95_00050 [Hymenobacter jeollabukensis]